MNQLSEEEVELDGPAVRDRVRSERPLRLKIHSTLRWVHIYISMASLLIVFFFAITGITLNHPDWVFGTHESVAEVEGTLPAGWRDGDAVDWLATVEHLRAEHGVRGRVIDYRIDEFEGTVAFRAPGYMADTFVDPETGDYQVAIVGKGFVGVMNDLHRGQDANGAWRLAVDVAGVFLALLSLTGIGLLLYLRRYRRSALVTMAFGGALVVMLMILTT